jgi:UDP-N-acetylmuramate--alanine ligase
MYTKNYHFHFMGIGGIGMSGLAKILAQQGYMVTGCDLSCDEKNVSELKKLGVKLCKGHLQELCADDTINTLVYSSAIKLNHPEIIAAQKRQIPVVARAEILAELMKSKYSIAVAGSHGKTTTSSLLSHILFDAKVDPTIIVGGHIKNIHSNAHSGSSKILVAEADESDRSFLLLHPTISIITNIDLEHLETYKDLDDIKKTFLEFIDKLPFYGKTILCIDDATNRSLLPLITNKYTTYGLTTDAELHAINVSLEASQSTFTVINNQKELGEINLPIAGRHNVLNSLAAISAALEMGLTFDQIKNAIITFQGVERRFMHHGTWRGAEIFDDYGHHPKEIESTLLVARKRALHKLHVVFQPHRYSRTQHLWNDFIKAFIDSNIDSLTITDIYAASEDPVEGITAQELAHAIQKSNPPFSVTYKPMDDQFQSIFSDLEIKSNEKDLILLLGAGKINQLASILIKKEAPSSV